MPSPTVGKINNEKELIQEAFKNGHIHFMEMSGGKINATELVGAIISQIPACLKSETGTRKNQRVP